MSAARSMSAGLAALALALALSLGVSVAGAVDVYVAFGDSITRGTGAPISSQIVFDCWNDCTPSSSPEACGYVDKLEALLPGPENVINEGKGGEETAAGVSRIDSVLNARCPGSPGDCVAVLLMEGTNDLGNALPVENTRANLSAMISKIEARNVDVLLMTIIRKVYAPGDTFWNSLRSAIITLGTQRQVPVLDVYGSLCASTACFDSRYWVPGSWPCLVDSTEGDLTLGHLDTEGYERLAGDLLAPFFPAAPPPPAAPSAPTGDVLGAQPTFTWPELAEARWYHLQVDGGSALDIWRKGAAVCANGTCAVTAPAPLAAGAHSWRVQGRNLRGVGAWSGAPAFTVWPSPPGPATPIGPAGDLFTSTPTYEWGEATDVVAYELEVEDGVGSVSTYGSPYDAATVCSGGSCAVTPMPALGPGAYSWRVRGTNPAAAGPWTAKTAFTVWETAPAPPTLLYPLADIFDTTPVYRWKAVPGASDYTFQLDAEATIPKAADEICSGGICQLEQAALTEGGHSWRVRARNPLGSSGWTARSFSVLACTPPVDRSLPTTPAVTTPVSEAACGVLRAVDGYVVGATGVVTFHGGGSVVLGNGFSVTAGGRFTARVDE